mmetsp:Transcript_6792/g.17587  ORF Transcript_6792/g.17587 Transcript_6792/m.17587 type:complete len:259 (+) Transcript_6792:1412-2188(+)
MVRPPAAPMPLVSSTANQTTRENAPSTSTRGPSLRSVKRCSVRWYTATLATPERVHSPSSTLAVSPGASNSAGGRRASPAVAGSSQTSARRSEALSTSARLRPWSRAMAPPRSTQRATDVLVDTVGGSGTFCRATVVHGMGSDTVCSSTRVSTTSRLASGAAACCKLRKRTAPRATSSSIAVTRAGDVAATTSSPLDAPHEALKPGTSSSRSSSAEGSKSSPSSAATALTYRTPSQPGFTRSASRPLAASATGGPSST